jgi:hypothetical protein
MELLQQRWKQKSIFINIHLGSTETIRQELYNSSIHGRVAIAKPLIIEIYAERGEIWCDDHKTWTSDDMKYTIWLDESSFMFPTSGWVCLEIAQGSL